MRELLHLENERLWLLIGLCVATVLTVEAVEQAVDGVWPYQRRPARRSPRSRGTGAIWGLVALLVLPGLVLAMLNVAALMQWDRPRTDAQEVGGVFLALGWMIFVLTSIPRLPLRRYLDDLGLAGPALVILLLLIGDGLLLIALFDVLPSMREVRDVLPLV